MFTQTIRRQFLQYFKERGHSIVPSSPVIPHDDPSLLFINAGMNQFKDVFLGKTTRDYKRAATAQKCIRVGGKHNDLENVGHTSRHLTFFEMLGNFSFGDYFKPEAIRFAWEVSTEVFGFAPDRIWPTVFREDDEAFEIWRQYVPADRITRFDEKDNFWMMGETGPCGPCSELLYDRGKEFGSGSKPSEDPSGERFLEFWNLVFMQSDRRASGEIVSLPSPSIDTGAGLERVVNLKTGTRTVFETDVLRELIAGTEAVTGISYRIDDERAAAFHVIADHLRCLAFAIADGVQPSNTDRGYVLRKVLRRAVRYGRRLGADRPFLADLLPGLISTMGGDYPELTKSRERIREILTVEEEAFLRTLRRGGNILNQVIEKAKHSGTIEGDEAFKLKDTYGLPLDEIRLIAKDSDLGIDEVRFNRLEEEARLRSRNIQKNTGQTTEINLFSRIAEERGESEFIGYTHLQGEATVVGVVVNGEPVDSIESGTEAVVLLNRTPFYAETGGQVGDTGFLTGPGVSFKVIDCQTPYKGIIAHRGVLLEGVLKTGDSLFAEVDKERRQKTANNHTATHLLHWALHQVLGEHIKQAGSVVDPGRLRFDFSHHKALSPEDVRRIEDLVNDKIRENRPVSRYELKYEEAQKRDDIKQFFGEKYGTVVRVVDIDYSKELCGGTHTDAVGTIGLFRIVKESSIAAGIRRIEAVTGKEAEEYVREQENLLSGIAESLKVPVNQVRERIEKLSEENRALVKEAKIGRTEKLKALVASLADRSVQEGELRSIVAEVSVSSEELVECLDLAFEQADSGVVLLAIKLPSGCRLAVKIGDKWIKRGFSAGDLIKLLMPIVDGSGGGKPGMAQGSGKSSERLEEALAKAREYLLEKATQ